MAELYSVDVDAPQATNLLTAKREQRYQLLEINTSYGAQGLVLFQTFEMDSQLPIECDVSICFEVQVRGRN